MKNIFSLFLIIILSSCSNSSGEDNKYHNQNSSGNPTPTVTRPIPHIFTGNIPEFALMRLGLGEFWEVKLSPDNEHLAVNSSVGIYILNSQSFIIERLIIPKRLIQEYAWLSDGKTIRIISQKENYFTDWSVVTGEKISSKYIYYPIVNAKKIVLSPNGEKLVLIYDRQIRLIDITLSTTIFAENVNFENTMIGANECSISWSKQDEIAFMDADNIIHIRNIITGQEVKEIITNHNKPRGPLSKTINLSPDGRHISITGFAYNEITIWDIEAGMEEYTIPIDSECWDLLNAFWSPDGDLIAVRCYPSRIVIIDINKKIIVNEILSRTYRIFDWIWFSDDTMFTVTNSSDVTLLTKWNILTGEAENTIRGTNETYNLSWSPNGRNIATSHGGSIVIWDIYTGEPSKTLDVVQDFGDMGAPNYSFIHAISYNTDGTRLAAEVGDDGCEILVWDTHKYLLLEENYCRIKENTILWKTNIDIQIGTGCNNPKIKPLDVSPDRKKAIENWNDLMGIIECKTGNILQNISLPIDKNEIGKRIELTYKWSPDGEDVAILINDGRLYIWNLQNNNLRLIYKIENIESYRKIMEWSPNGKRLAIGYSRGNHDYNEEEIGNILLLDLPTNVIIMNLEFETLIRDIGFSLDSSKMAIAKRDGTTLIFNNS